jgi:hypothetical protein
MERTNVFLGPEDRARIEEIRRRYGLASAGAAIRFALRLAVPDEIQSVQAARPRRQQPGGTG